MLAPHPRKGDQTCELKAYALQKSPQNIRLRSKLLRCHMLGCPGCCVEHADRPLSASSCLAQKKTLVYPSVSENKNSGLRPGGIGPDVGHGMRVLRRFLISCGGRYFLVCWDLTKKCRIRKCAGREAEVRQIGREKAEFLGEVGPKSPQQHARYFPPFCSLFERMR